jgi:ABC-type uncharacterized transport system ATPase subunit
MTVLVVGTTWPSCGEIARKVTVLHLGGCSRRAASTRSSLTKQVQQIYLGKGHHHDH